MTDQITAGTVPTVVAKRFGGHGLRIECPFCRTRKGKGKKPIIHVHGTGGEAGIGLPGPWHGHRLAHCNPDNLPPAWREWHRNHSLGYYIVEEVSDPRAIEVPPSLVPNERAAFSTWLSSRCGLASNNVVELRSRVLAEPADDAVVVASAGG